MASSNNGSAGGGIGFCGLLTILFIGLKLTDNIDWSWLWVLSPLWIPLAVGLAVGAVVLVVMAIGFVISELSKSRRRKRRR